MDGYIICGWNKIINLADNICKTMYMNTRNWLYYQQFYGLSAMICLYLAQMHPYRPYKGHLCMQRGVCISVQ